MTIIAAIIIAAVAMPCVGIHMFATAYDEEERIKGIIVGVLGIILAAIVFK